MEFDRIGIGPLISAFVRDLPLPDLVVMEELLTKPLSKVFLPRLGAWATDTLLILLFLEEAMVLDLAFDLEKDLNKPTFIWSPTTEQI